MEIKLTNLGKRFNLEWIFRHVDYTFKSGNLYAVTGSNGSGKSTLLQVIAGAMMHNEGDIEYINASLRANISTDNIYTKIAIAAPYLELIEEMTATELIHFHGTFKQFICSADEVLKTIGLYESRNKQIRYFSSGMKQRLKLGLAFFADTEILLLDEPCTNLDISGIELYHQLIQRHAAKRLVIICSNDKTEYDCCNEIIEIDQYKKD